MVPAEGSNLLNGTSQFIAAGRERMRLGVPYKDWRLSNHRLCSAQGLPKHVDTTLTLPSDPICIDVFVY